jgi:hypothetical protein
MEELSSVMMANNGMLIGKGCLELYLTSKIPPIFDIFNEVIRDELERGKKNEKAL